MRLDQAASPIFARHETFHPRYGWFRKSYSFTDADPNVFNREDAIVRIGVGKNMVRSIRFWGLAAKLIEENSFTGQARKTGTKTTDIGNAIFGNSGWDPYMEFPGTLWLMHWLLFSPRSRLPVWWIAFNEFNAVEFTENDLEIVVVRHLTRNANWKCPSVSAIKKDISTLLRTYAPTAYTRNSGVDELLDCPLRELKLIGLSESKEKYRFTNDDKPTLPSEILIFSLLDFISHSNDKGSSTNINRLVYEPGAPGKIFKLTENQLLTKLEEVTSSIESLRLTSSAGVAQIVWFDNPRKIANQILDDYYKSLHQMGFGASKIEHN